MTLKIYNTDTKCTCYVVTSKRIFGLNAIDPIGKMIWKSVVGICVFFSVCGMGYFATAEIFYVNMGNKTQLSCITNISYPQWRGPENLDYNYADKPKFNPNLGEKISRLSWGNNKHDLHISNVRRNDSGKYICLGIEKYLSVRVVPLPPSVMESQGSTISGSEGVTLTLICKSSGGFPDSNIVWYNTSSSSSSNALTTTTTRVHINSSDTYNITGTHSFLPSASDDRVKFICMTFFKDGFRNEQQTEVTLVLNLKPRQPTIEQLSTVIAGNSVEVKCETTGSRPAATINWSYRNTNLTGATTTTLDSSTNTYTVVSVLTRQVTAAEDNGQSVTCNVTHILMEPSQLTATLNLNVQFSAKYSSTTITGNNGSIATGSALTLNCTTGSSNPASDIIWKNNSEPISISLQYTSWKGENNGQVRSQNLVLYPTRYMDGDVITCSVSNVVNTQSPITDTATLDLQYSPIVLIEGLQQITFTEGESKLLSCKVESKPTSTIEWYHGNSRISQGNPGNNILNYSLTPVNRTDYGVYRCKANNGIGTEDEEQISVNVRFKPLTTTISGNTNIIADGKNQLRLTCTSGSSYPMSDIEWKSNTDIPLNIGSQSSAIGEYGGMKSSRTLTLTPARENDGHTLLCQANNTIGTSTKITATLNLKYRPLIQSMSEVFVVEGNNTELTCIASSKPASTFKWYREGVSSILKQGTGTLDNNKLSYMINVVKRIDASTYTCNADNGIETADNQNVRLTVHYPPDVTPRTTNTTVNEASAIIICNASGIPNITYKYGKWIQTWPVNSTLVSERDGSRILELTQLTYEHSGIYTCSASNGIKVFGTNQKFKEGSVQLLVKSFPIITAWDDKSPARFKENATVKVDFYSNIDGSVVKCYKIVDGSEEKQVKCSVSDTPVEVDLPVFTHIIRTAGTRAMVMIEIQSEKDFGFYKVVVQNEINSTSRSVQIVPKGPPSVPYNMTIDEVQINTAQISWIRGFHGGFAQTFVIQFSTDLTVWRNKSLDGGLSESKEAVSTVLSGLKDSTTYYLRMYAVNQEGESHYTDILNYTTSFVEEQPPNNSALIGGAAGGSAALIVILAIVIVVTLRRRGFFAKDKSSTHADKSDRKPVYEDDDDNDVGMQDNPMYESAGPRHQGQSAGASRTCDVGAVYSTVDKKKPVIGNSNDVYAEVDKSKTTGQKPGKKEKSKPDKKGKKAAKEGELYANAAATEMKITKTKQNANDETIYENPEPSKQKAKKNVNKDGLIYADLTFNDQPKGQKKLVIHGLDSMTEYVEVDFTKKADPLPDSDDENDSQRK